MGFWTSSLASTISFLASVLLIGASGNNRYCRISPQHTMCRYQGINSICGNVISREVRSQSERDEILTLHNRARSKVALGQESRGRRGPQPPAADMFELTWDPELAAVAQRWAEQCHFGHDSTRDVERFRVGQNVHISYETGSCIDPSRVDWRKAILSFYDEVAILDNSNVQSYRFDHATGHYTQMVWSTTTRIGCGKMVYRKGKTLNKYLVCNYGKAGNILSTPMYKIGPACSACPFGCAGNGLCRGPGGNGGLISNPPIVNNHPIISTGPLLPQLGPINLPSLPFSNHLQPPQGSFFPTSFGGGTRPIITNNNNFGQQQQQQQFITTNNRPNNIRPSPPQSTGLLPPFMDISNPFRKPANGGFSQGPFGGMIDLLMPFNFGNIRFP